MSDITVCVIGAGASGLTAIKACLENNLSVTCYECSPSIGGIWSTNVTKYTVTNSSKEHSAFSDFTPPRQYPVFMHQGQVREYLQQYAEHFNLLTCIQFNHRVTGIKQITTPSGAKKWQVNTVHINSSRECNDSLETQSTRVQCFDAVLLCTGNNEKPLIPDIVGMKDKFTGSIIHSSDLYGESDSSTIDNNDNVVVIGGGNSAGDAAVWAADRSNKPIILLIKSLPWIVPRRGPSGKPFDETLNCRAMRAKLKLIPGHFLTNYISQLLVETIYFDHKLYCGGIKPSHGILDDQCMINDILPFKMLTGNVKILQFSSIVTLNERSIDVVVDGKKISLPCDRVIFATGFNNKLREKQIIGQLLSDLDDSHAERVNKFTSNDASDEKVNYPLYKHMYIPEYGHSFAVIGSISPLGPVFPIVEVQSRWACRLIATRGRGDKSVHPLPPIDKMKSIIAKDLSRQPQASSKANLVDWLHYIDDIASQISSCPSFVPLLLRDPIAWYYTYFGPCYSYQFRLNESLAVSTDNCKQHDRFMRHHDDEETHCNWSLMRRQDKLKVNCSAGAAERTKSSSSDHLDAGGSKYQSLWSRCFGNVTRNDEPRRALFTASHRIEDAFKLH